MAASPETLMRQAPQTAELYLRAVIRSIDSEFGEGYSKANPGLVGAMVAASASDFSASMLCNSLDRVADAINAGLSNLA